MIELLAPSPATRVLLDRIDTAKCSLPEMESRVRRITREIAEMQAEVAGWSLHGGEAVYDEGHPELKPRVENQVTQRFGAMQRQLSEILPLIRKIAVTIRDMGQGHKDIQAAVKAADEQPSDGSVQEVVEPDLAK